MKKGDEVNLKNMYFVYTYKLRAIHLIQDNTYHIYISYAKGDKKRVCYYCCTVVRLHLPSVSI